MYCTRSSSRCSGMQGICAWLTGGSRSSSRCRWYARHPCSIDWGSVCLLYICIVLDIALCVVVCKASVVRLAGGSRSSSGCSGMQGISAQLTVGSICLLYICIVLDISRMCSGMQGICGKLTGGSICLLYISIVLYLAVGVAVCKASLPNWLGDPSAFYKYAL